MHVSNRCNCGRAIKPLLSRVALMYDSNTNAMHLRVMHGGLCSHCGIVWTPGKFKEDKPETWRHLFKNWESMDFWRICYGIRHCGFLPGVCVDLCEYGYHFTDFARIVIQDNEIRSGIAIYLDNIQVKNLDIARYLQVPKAVLLSRHGFDIMRFRPVRDSNRVTGYEEWLRVIQGYEVQPQIFIARPQRGRAFRPLLRTGQDQ